MSISVGYDLDQGLRMKLSTSPKATLTAEPPA
jgi:hypothetical protein